VVSQSARQEEHISDLEADLEAAMLQLKEKEKELEYWKKHVCQLTELSISSPTAGTLPTLLSADCLLSCWTVCWLYFGQEDSIIPCIRSISVSVKSAKTPMC
jgi:hypothetical protein